MSNLPETPDTSRGGELLYRPAMWEAHVDLGCGWFALRPSIPATAPPYRYDWERDAQALIDRLYPELPPSKRKAMRV